MTGTVHAYKHFVTTTVEFPEQDTHLTCLLPNEESFQLSSKRESWILLKHKCSLGVEGKQASALYTSEVRESPVSCSLHNGAVRRPEQGMCEDFTYLSTWQQSFPRFLPFLFAAFPSQASVSAATKAGPLDVAKRQRKWGKRRVFIPDFIAPINLQDIKALPTAAPPPLHCLANTH